jgi:hypothetical protein
MFYWLFLPLCEPITRFLHIFVSFSLLTLYTINIASKYRSPLRVRDPDAIFFLFCYTVY